MGRGERCWEVTVARTLNREVITSCQWAIETCVLRIHKNNDYIRHWKNSTAGGYLLLLDGWIWCHVCFSLALAVP